MFSFEIASQVTWKSLPILPSIFGLSSQNIVIPHYPCHSDTYSLFMVLRSTLNCAKVHFT